tara:strand:+ start:144 stop:338 length:195 start_codon:yes stop_codon:yes gene_type:complete
MIFSALANNGTKKVKENLDSSIELQEFMNKMENRCFLNVVITATKQDGTSKILTYNFNGQEWEI